jgi:hypothetical protein
MTSKKKRAKRTPAQREAMKYAYWNKWCPGGSPDKVLRTNKIDYEDPWYVSKITPSELDGTITKVVK